MVPSRVLRVLLLVCVGVVQAQSWCGGYLSYRDTTFFHTNQQCTGEVPSSILYAQQLVEFDVSDNLLTGTVPWIPFKLTRYSMARNNLAGTIPNLDKRTKLSKLHLGGNKLVGTIPPLAPNLVELDLRDNMLTGPLPYNLISTTKLRYTWLNDNLLTGTIPTYLTGRGYTLMLANNYWTCPIPSSYYWSVTNSDRGDLRCGQDVPSLPPTAVPTTSGHTARATTAPPTTTSTVQATAHPTVIGSDSATNIETNARTSSPTPTGPSSDMPTVGPSIVSPTVDGSTATPTVGGIITSAPTVDGTTASSTMSDSTTAPTPSVGDARSDTETLLRTAESSLQPTAAPSTTAHNVNQTAAPTTQVFSPAPALSACVFAVLMPVLVAVTGM